MHVAQGRRRRAASIGAVLLVVVPLFGLTVRANAQSLDLPEFVDLRGSATGQPAHVTGLESGGTRLVNAEVAWSGAAVDADEGGLTAPQLNEVNRAFVAAKTGEDAEIADPANTNIAGKFSYGRGSGLELGLGTTPEDANQLILGPGPASLAEQAAPPDHDAPSTSEIAIEGDPVAYASALRGRAQANVNDSGLVPDYCVLGEDISRGIGYAADVELIDTAGADDGDPTMEGAVLALDDQNPQRSVSQSYSHTFLMPNGAPNGYGLASEVRQTIAPVTILQTQAGTDGPELRAVTIELLGEWVLRVFAPGNGPATVQYGPGDDSPETPILRIITDSVNQILKFQDVFTDEGVQLPAELAQVIDLSIGEDPRAIAEPGTAPDPESDPVLAKNGTDASAAVDVLRIRLLSQPDPQAADIRVGHMEVRAHTPLGGVECPIPVDKEANRDLITIGGEPDTARFTITVHNPFDCDMVNTALTDRITQDDGDPNFKVIETKPPADGAPDPETVVTEATLKWDLGTIPSGGKKSVEVEIQSANQGGVLEDIATAEAKLQNCKGEDGSGLGLAGLGIGDLDVSGLSVPVDVAIETPLTGTSTTRTAATGGMLALAAVALGLFLRRRGAQQT